MSSFFSGKTKSNYTTRMAGLKTILTAIICLFVCMARAQHSSPVPSVDELLPGVVQKAKAQEKKVLLVFQASWCGWCRKLDASLQDPDIKPLVDKFYETLHLTVYESATKKHLENKGALEFLSKHGGAGIGVPFWFILDGEGNVITDSKNKSGENTGCPATAEEVAYFTGVLKETSGLTAEELEVIRKRFRKNN